MRTIKMTPKFEVVEDAVLENTSEDQRMVKETILTALAVFIDSREGIKVFEKEIEVAYKLLYGN